MALNWTAGDVFFLRLYNGRSIDTQAGASHILGGIAAVVLSREPGSIRVGGVYEMSDLAGSDGRIINRECTEGTADYLFTLLSALRVPAGTNMLGTAQPYSIDTGRTDGDPVQARFLLRRPFDAVDVRGMLEPDRIVLQ